MRMCTTDVSVATAGRPRNLTARHTTHQCDALRIAFQPFCCESSEFAFCLGGFLSQCGEVCPAEGGIDLYCTDQPCFGQNTTANPYLYARESTRLIRQQSGLEQSKLATALMIFLALHNVHQPVESPPEFVDLYPASDYNSSNYARRIYNGSESLRVVITVLLLSQPGWLLCSALRRRVCREKCHRGIEKQWPMGSHNFHFDW